VIVRPASLPDVLVVEPKVFTDSRGLFFEGWQEQRYAEAGIALKFVQDSVSRSARGVIRGLHFQHPGEQGKLVSVLHGAAFDVAVDVRVGSPTFGRWVGEELSAANCRQQWIPPGFAHGFQALADDTVMLYKVSDVYRPDCERAVRYDDAAIGVAWPLKNARVSPRDAAAARLADLPKHHLPSY